MVRPGHRGHKNSLPQKKIKITERARKTYKQNKFYFEKKKDCGVVYIIRALLRYFYFLLKKIHVNFFDIFFCS
jgi:hypothetical protein